MGDKSKISWTDATWNPTVGCTRVSAGCDNCYAYALHDRRHLAWKRGTWPDAPQQYHQPFSKVQLLPGRLDQPLRWRKPRRIFVDSMSDLFHEDVPDEFIDRVFATMRLAHAHTFQVLTKRPERMRDYLRPGGVDSAVPIYRIGTASDEIKGETTPSMIWPLPNVWLGVSVENQATADERIPLLLKTPAAVRFVSYEPVLGPVNIEPWVSVNDHSTFRAARGALKYAGLPNIDWVIAGGESGPHYRPMNLEWVAHVREQCRAAGVAWFGKQDAGPRPGIPLPGDLGDREFPQRPGRIEREAR